MIIRVIRGICDQKSASLPAIIPRLKKLSVIIVSYNVCYFLEQALLAVRNALAQVEAEVFVVDNHSADHSAAMVQRRFPEVKLICNDTNLGFAKANNQAIALAEGQYILLLNPDTVVQEDTFRSCIHFMDNHPEAGGLGVKMLDGKGNFLPESMRGLPTPAVAFYKITGLTALFPRSSVFGRYYLGYLDAGQVQEVDVLAGAFMWLRRESLQRTGLLDESFFMYGEDIDLSYRLQKAGYKNYYLPHTQIIHYKGESTRRGSLNYVYLFYRAMSVFVKKHFSGRQAVFFSLLIQLAIVGRAMLSVGARLAGRVFPFLADDATRYPRTKKWKVAVAGGAEEYHRVATLLRTARVPARLLGFFSANPADRSASLYLGELARLQEVSRLKGLDEIIFSGKDLAAGEIMAWMVKLKNQDLDFKILPEGSEYIIGSHSKNSRGHYYVLD
jgi:GT2 family glycosyltransferase